MARNYCKLLIVKKYKRYIKDGHSVQDTTFSHSHCKLAGDNGGNVVQQTVS